MSYQILAQKYRPQVFDDVIGQEAATKTLVNSITAGRIANAYIFCGPRGIGKTSVARILAKTLNCEKPKGSEPCNKCDSCKEISLGSNIDVLEIDGASNRGIDEIRALRENVKFSPSKGKFKIYIIDEVHMLTQEAFNALLKTLEEPPAHVKFIFATTEPHKVLPTIMSRCQRFDFKKISPRLIYERVKLVAKKEKITLEENASLLIARSSDGSLRDGLVILDQMVSFSGSNIKASEVTELLGMVERDKVMELAESVIIKDPQKVTKTVDEFISGGKDPSFINSSLMQHFRDLMVLKTSGSPTSDMAFSDEELGKLNDQAGKLSLDEVLYILQSLSNCTITMKGTTFARAPLEIALIRLTKRADVLAIPELIKKLEEVDFGCGEASGVTSESPERKELQEEKPLPKEEAPVQMTSKKSFKTEEKKTEFLSDPETDSNGTNGGSDAANGQIEQPKQKWKAILNYVRNKKMSVFTFLNAASPSSVTENKIIISFSKEHSFNKDALEAEQNKKIIQEAVDKVMGRSMRVAFVLTEEDSSEESKLQTADKKQKSKEKMKPVIEKAMDIFGGHVVRDIMEEG